MANFQLSPVPRLQFLDPNGKPYGGGTLQTFAAGTSNPLATFADSIGTPNPTTITLDSAGRCTAYLGSSAYKFSLFDVNSVLVFTQDNIQSNYISLTDFQTFQNKTFDDTNVITVKDSNFTVEANGATTAKFQFSAGNVTPGNTRVISVRDQNFTMAGLETQNNFSARQGWAQGANVASSGNLVLGSDGNLFEITGVTQINAIDATIWSNGSIVVLTFASALTLKNNTVGGTGTKPMLLQGAQDYAVQSGDVVMFQLQNLGAGGINWVEISRSYHAATDRTIQTIQLTLTNAQILLLPTTAVAILSAPGAGRFIQILNWAVKMDLTAGIYTNVDPTAVLGLTTSSVAPVSVARNSNNTIFNKTTDIVMVHLRGGNDSEAPDLYSKSNNQGVAIVATNGALGNFTGGNAANTLVIYVTYQIRTA